MLPDAHHQQVLVRFIEILLLALVYFITALAAHSMALPPANITPVWIPSGIVLAVLLLNGYRLWPGIFLGAFSVTVFACTDAGIDGLYCLVAASLNALGITLGTLLAAYLINKYTNLKNPLHKSAHIGLLFVSVFPAAFLSALPDIISPHLIGRGEGAELMPVALGEFSSHVVGILVTTPLVLSFFSDRRATRFSELPLYSLILLLLISLSFGVVQMPMSAHLVLFMITPVLIWSVLRLCEQVTFTSILVISLVAAILTAMGRGPFAEHQTIASLLELQLFIVAISSTILLLNSVVNERQAASWRLSETYHQLEDLVEKRTRDLSEALQREMRVNEQLSQTQKQLILSHKKEALGTLTGGIAHNFNNILNAIIGNAELALMKEQARGGTANYLETIVVACKRAAGLVKQIRSYTRLSPAEFQPTNLVNPIREAITLAGAYTNDLIKIDLHCDKDKIIINGDSQTLTTAFLHILENACQSIPDTAGTITVTCLSDHLCPPELLASFGHCARISIIDTGTGIETEIIDKIFDPFFTTREVGKGAGLGLSAAHGIIDSHNGVIEVNSEVGHGTTFDIYLPLLDDMNHEITAHQDNIDA